MKKTLAWAVFFLALAAAAGCKNQPAPPPADAAGSTVEPAASGMGGDCGSAKVLDGLTAVRAPAGEAPADGDMLVRRMEAEPGTLNPVISTDVASQDIQYYVIESLLDVDLATGELKPLTAESWEVAPDKVTFIFHLRRDVTFHDGKPMTADDVIYTLGRIMDPKVDAPSLRSYFVDCESFVKLDDYAIQIKWKRPYFKALEMIGGVPVLPKHLLDDGTDFNKHPYSRHPVGTGPYRFREWETGRKIELVRNDKYWGKKPHFDRVLFKVITNDDVSLQVLKKGEIDFIERLRRVQWIKQTASKDFAERFHKIHYDYPSYSYIGWNLRRPVFADKRVRQAMTMLLNRPAMLKEIFYCLGAVARGPFLKQTPYADPDLPAWPYDPARAKALLAEAGWSDTDGDGVVDKDGQAFRFELSFTAEVPEWEQMAVIYREDLKKAGIDMVIRKLEWAVFLENVQQWKFDACAMAWAMDANPDPYQLWHSSQADLPASSNHVGFKSAEVDRLIEQNREEFDKQKRIEYCRSIDRIIHDEQPYTFFLSGEHLSAAAKRVRNILPQPIRPCLNYNEWYVPAGERKYTSGPGP